MSDETRTTMKTEIELAAGVVRIEAEGDRLMIYLSGSGVIEVADDEMRHFVQAIRAVANAAGAEGHRMWAERHYEKFGERPGV